MKTVTWWLGITMFAFACGGSNGESTFDPGIGSNGGNGGNAGSLISVPDAATYGEASADGGEVLPGDDCPATPPTKGAACTASLVCTYDACPTTGTTTATCDGKTWTLATAACAAVPCPAAGTQKTCPAGQICLIVKMVTADGGTTNGLGCFPNPCGEGPIACRCFAPSAGNSCSGGCTSAVGHEVQCVQ
jgi:hypothetical protein